MIFTPILNELNPPAGPLLTLAQNIGLLVGAFTFGLLSDITGRRFAFNITLFLAGSFGVIAGSSPTFLAVAVFAALYGLGTGGNLPVDAAIFLEFLPGSKQYMLTIMSIWWGLGQIVTNLIAWPLLGNFSCQENQAVCTREQNMGWRYLLFAMGGIILVLFGIRIFVFKLYESPKYLIGRNMDEKAVEIIHNVAAYNHTTSSLSVDQLLAVETEARQVIASRSTSGLVLLRQRLKQFDASHVKSLFSTRKLAWSTSLIILIWGLIGLAFPLYNAYLPYFLASRGAELGDGSTAITYRNTLIIALMAIPGSLLAGLLVELPRFGRRGALSLSTASTGVFLFLSTTARSSNAILGWNCAYNFTSNIMYGVLYAYTPEVFSTKDRGTGMGLAATMNRLFGIMAPIIAIKADLTTSIPIYVSGALFIGAGLIVVLLPYEPMGRSSS